MLERNINKRRSIRWQTDHHSCGSWRNMAALQSKRYQMGTTQNHANICTGHRVQTMCEFEQVASRTTALGRQLRPGPVRFAPARHTAMPAQGGWQGWKVPTNTGCPKTVGNCNLCQVPNQNASRAATVRGSSRDDLLVDSFDMPRIIQWFHR